MSRQAASISFEIPEAALEALSASARERPVRLRARVIDGHLVAKFSKPDSPFLSSNSTFAANDLRPDAPDADPSSD